MALSNILSLFCATSRASPHLLSATETCSRHEDSSAAHTDSSPLASSSRFSTCPIETCAIANPQLLTLQIIAQARCKRGQIRNLLRRVRVELMQLLDDRVVILLKPRPLLVLPGVAKRGERAVKVSHGVVERINK